jgi:hypothetical protein
LSIKTAAKTSPKAHAIIAGWSFSQDINHTKPLTRAPAALFAVMMSAAGHPRAGAALVIQQSRGLRAIEILALCPEHVMFSSRLADSFDKPKTATVRLGAKRGTKVKREQFVIFREAQQPDAYKLLECLVNNTTAGERLFPVSHWTYRRLISDAECKLGLEVGFTPHSARAGFATEAVSSGESFDEIRNVGRWKSEESFRIYVDVIAAAQIETSFATNGLQPLMKQALQHLHSYFTPAIFRSKVRHAGEGISPRPGRALDSSRSHSRSSRSSSQGRQESSHAFFKKRAEAHPRQDEQSKLGGSRGRGRGRSRPSTRADGSAVASATNARAKASSRASAKSPKRLPS